jgi:hypothetical protein
MPVIVTMRGELTGTVLDESFDDTLLQFEKAHAQGADFMALHKTDGYRRAFYLPNVNHIDEVSDDDVPLV